jgi:putative aldouronate transport system permease protein
MQGLGYMKSDIINNYNAGRLETRKKSFIKNLIKDKSLYIMLLPALIYLIIFNYIPMMGLVIVFKDFSPVKGIINSDWIGLENFRNMITSPDFYPGMKVSLLLIISNNHFFG